MLVVIFSDFEIENFFKISNFSLNFQKTVLFQAINYCLDRTTKEQHESVYIKFQFWVLKLMNKNISITGEINPIPPISSEELNQSIDSLIKKLNNFNNNSPQKCFLLKVSYELGYYFYLTNDLEKMKYNLNLCSNNMDYEAKDTNFNTIYFDRSELISLIRICDRYEFLMGDNIYENLEENVDMTDNTETKLDLTKDSKIVEQDFENFFNKISIDPQAKLIIDVKNKN